MKIVRLVTLGLFLGYTALVGAVGSALAQEETLRLAGLVEPVEIITDRWGIAHIYADTEADLFFAQGFNAARDRLFQFELWRRKATGTTAEILGRRTLQDDVGSRLFRFGGDLTQELNHYHPRGEAIVQAFVRGINAYIDLTEQRPELLPIEFDLLGITPGRWTTAVVISRHQGLLSNLTRELAYGRAVARVGAETGPRAVLVQAGRARPGARPGHRRIAPDRRDPGGLSSLQAADQLRA